MLLFFSSDSNALYKKDVLSALSLPKGYCVHFRYWASIIAPELLPGIENLTGEDGIIIYVKGNTGDVLEDRQVSFLPVRRVTVRNCHKNQQTQLIHFNLELGDFLNCDITYPGPSLRPPYIFVQNGAMPTFEIKSWQEKINDLVLFDPSMNKSLFYNVKLLEYNWSSETPIDIPFSIEEDSSHFILSESNSYILDLSVLIAETDPKEFDKYECKLVYDTQNLKIPNPSSIIIGAPLDNRRYSLVTKSVSSAVIIDYLKIIAVKNGEGKDGKESIESYETILRFKIRKSTRKAGMYVLLLSLNLIGTALFAYFVSHQESSILFAIAGLLCVVFSGVGQYLFYNKT